jgi:hypothetical protein
MALVYIYDVKKNKKKNNYFTKIYFLIVYCISRVENERFRLLMPRAYGLWLNSANSCEIEFSTRGIHDIFPTTTKKTLIFGIPSNFKYHSTELRTK